MLFSRYPNAVEAKKANTSIMPKLVLAALLAGTNANSGNAAGECGAENLADASDTLSCAGGVYASGITYSGSDGLRLVLDDASISVANTGVSVTSSGTSTGDIYVDALNFDTISTSANGAHGLTADITNPSSEAVAQVRLTRGDITTTGDQAYGLYAKTSGSSAAIAFMEGGTISTTGSGSYGLFADSTNTASQLSFANAIQAGGATIVTGANSVGLYARMSGAGLAAVTVAETSVVSATGDGSDGVRVTIDNANAEYQIYLDASASVTGGSGAGAGVRTESVAGSSGIMLFEAGATVNGAAGAGAVLDGAGDTYLFSNGNVIGDIKMGLGSDMLDFGRLADVSGLSLLDGGTGGDVDYLFIEDQVFERSGAFFANWEYIYLVEGSTTITDGTFTVGTRLTLSNGATFDAGNSLNFTGGLSVDSASRFQATGGGVGAYNISGSVLNAGSISMADNATGDLLTIAGNYTGGGTLILDVDTATGTADMLHVQGDATGTTGLGFTNLSPNSVNGQDIAVVTVAGASEAGNFVLLDGPLTAGAYDYNLDYQAGSFVLGASINATGTMYEAAPAVLAGVSQLPSLTLRQSGNICTDSGFCSWASLYHDNLETTISTGTAISSVRRGLKAGLSHSLEAGQNGRWAVGLSGQYDTQNATLSGQAGGGAIESQGFGLGVSATWRGDNGTYFDAQGQKSWLRTDFSSQGAGLLAENRQGSTLALSLEAGHRFALGTTAALLPQAQLIWAQAEGGVFVDALGNDIDLGTHASLQGRIGLAYEFAGKGGFQGHIIGNILHNFATDSVISIGSSDLNASSVATWAELGVGGTLDWGDKSRLYGNAAYRTALGGSPATNAGLSVTAGLQIAW